MRLFQGGAGETAISANKRLVIYILRDFGNYVIVNKEIRVTNLRKVWF